MMQINNWYLSKIIPVLENSMINVAEAMDKILDDPSIFGPFLDGCILYPHEINTLPELPAVYEITQDESLYIGRTTNLKKRFINGHHINKYLFSNSDVIENIQNEIHLALTWMDCSPLSRSQIKTVEEQQIKARKPIFNQFGVSWK